MKSYDDYLREPGDDEPFYYWTYQLRQAGLGSPRRTTPPLPAASGAEMSAFGGKAVVEWCCEESPRLTLSGRGIPD